jgi:hypothetical protein
MPNRADMFRACLTLPQDVPVSWSGFSWKNALLAQPWDRSYTSDTGTDASQQQPERWSRTLRGAASSTFTGQAAGQSQFGLIAREGRSLFSVSDASGSTTSERDAPPLSTWIEDKWHLCGYSLVLLIYNVIEDKWHVPIECT